ncbi:MAG: hypothetical protein MI923_02635 [Phycisphaerales bacterium]|nr:hypothetical protein [Phycisphaerales bacterium]
MSKAKQAPDDHRWEKEYAPKVSRGRVVLSLLVYLGFVGFLAYLAAQRWFGDLH